MTDSINDKTIWHFYPVEPIAGLLHIPLEENTVFSPEQFVFQFQGYKTGYGLNASIWGKKISLSLSIAPEGTLRETLPREQTEIVSEDLEKTLSEEKQQYIKTLRTKRDALKKTLPPPADEALEKQYWQYIDFEHFAESFKKAVAIWNDPTISSHSKCEQVGLPLTEIYQALQSMQLPDELMRDDTQFTVMLTKIMQFSKTAWETAIPNKVTLPQEVHQLTQLTDTLTDKMIEGGNKLYGIPRDMTQDEYDAYIDMKLVALYSDKPIKERLSLLETLWDYSLADLDDRITFLDTAIELIKKEAVHCPDETLINRHLSVISDHIEKLETEGEIRWQHRIAEKLVSVVATEKHSANQPIQTVTEWAPYIRLHSINIETQEQENTTVNTSLTLFFLDDNRVFDNRFIQAIIKNGSVTDITISD